MLKLKRKNKMTDLGGRREIGPRKSLVGISQDGQREKSLVTINQTMFDKKCSKSLDDLLGQVDLEPQYAKGGGDAFAPRKFSKTLVRSKSVSNDAWNKTLSAKRCVVNLMMLNAWRRQKVEYKIALEKVDALTEKVEGFEMQVYVLRQLLNAEKNRVESVTRNIQDLMQKIENSDREKTQMAEANNELKISLKNQMIFCSHLENTLRNKENEIMNYRVEVEDWEKQMANKREKLKAIETTSMVLKKKAQAAEEVAAMKGMQLEKLSAVQMELQSKLSSLEAVNMKLKVTEMAKNDLEKVVETRNLEVKQLRCIINTLQNSLQEEDEKNGILNKTILEKTNELSLVEQKLVDLTKSNYPWSGGAFRMASLCAKIPVACICTVGSLLLPFPSYRI